MPQLLKEEISTNLITVEDESNLIVEPRKRPNSNDSYSRYKRRTPLKDVANEQHCSNKVREYTQLRAARYFSSSSYIDKKIRFHFFFYTYGQTSLMYSSTSPQPYDCYFDSAAVWAPVVYQTTPVAAPKASSCQAYVQAECSSMDHTQSATSAKGVLDAIAVEPCESADSFFASTGKSPPQSIVPSPSVVGDFNVALSCTGDITQAASSILALTSGVKRWARWTAQEDQLLENAVAMEGVDNWILISAKYFNGSRNEVQIKNRWKKTLQPGLKKNVKWTEEEDAIILECVVQKGITSWSEIALLLQGESSGSNRAVLLLGVQVQLRSSHKCSSQYQEKQMMKSRNATRLRWIPRQKKITDGLRRNTKF
jgi:hypothetical protein